MTRRKKKVNTFGGSYNSFVVINSLDSFEMKLLATRLIYYITAACVAHDDFQECAPFSRYQQVPQWPMDGREGLESSRDGYIREFQDT